MRAKLARETNIVGWVRKSLSLTRISLRRACSQTSTVISMLVTQIVAESRDVLVVQDDSQKGSVDCEFAVVLDEAQFPEFSHEIIDP